ncbi:protein adenylyltransferase SelO [Peribacillus kribbensis]|uniref:protein adenylyltransferase SelO n=1 Tax=Peribacillus kribbensis TaxID=356658 RepID=UPI00041672B5|nr:YdiU family protein [Peribacillus kribbensis]
MTKNIGWNLDNSYSLLPQKFYTSHKPKPVASPELVMFNENLAAELGFNAEALKTNEGVAIFAGNELPEGAFPLAQAYAGHQFGHFTMLGDGRAVLLGEQITPEGGRVDIQLKGPGRTPYSRGGDGRAALGPMLREYIISEAMHGLGIPTTRSLAVVKTGEPVYRETELQGAILTRVAASHLRVGTFEFAANWGTEEELRALADYALERHYPDAETGDNRYLALLQGVIKRQALLIAKWQLAGFIHGVMNTDNMTISGETIDYGPCAFMDVYDPAAVFSSIDVQGRYAYGNQPGIGSWNLARFAEAMIPLLHEDQDQALELAQEAISEYKDHFYSNWLEGMRAKLGIFGGEEGDKALVEQLLGMMQKNRADFTNTFLDLTFGRETAMSGTPEFTAWHEKWIARRSRQEQTEGQAAELMKNSNPAVIPRNHRVEEALEAAESGDYHVMKRLLHVLASPYAHTAEQEKYAALPEPSDCPYQTFCGT